MNEATPEWKQKALEQFSAWLSELPDERPVDPVEEQRADLYTLAEELTALRQEMRTLGRTTASIAESTKAVSENLKEELPKLLSMQTPPQQTPAAASQRVIESAKKEAQHPLLMELGDLSEALNELSLRETTFDWPRYIPRSVRKKIEAQHSSKPLEVLNARIKPLLQRHMLSPVVQIGDAFEAASMNASGTSDKGLVPSHCVSAIVRQGYRCGSELIRIAEVIIEEKKA